MRGLVDAESHLAIDYDATESPTLDRFHCADNFMRAIMGPVGSGKSVACSIETMLRATDQLPLKDSKYRPSKFAVVRNTLGQLDDTTIETFQQWIPPEIGNYNASKHLFEMEFPHPSGDGTIVECNVLYRALDRPKDVRKLLSMELTGAWFNEAREIPWGVVDVMQTRVGRYPPHKLCREDSWSGIWLDTNPPDEDSKFYRIFEEQKPKDYVLFRQPGGLSKDAENVPNLKPGYYQRLVNGKSDDWIGVYVNAMYGFVQDGRPVYPEYNDLVHTSQAVVPYIEHETILLGMDFGLTPACVFIQEHAGTYYVIDEVVTENMGAMAFGDEVARRLRSTYHTSKVEGWGDPAGDQRSAIDERDTVFNILHAKGLPIDKAHTQDPIARREAVAKMLTSLGMTGKPRLVISPNCKYLRRGLRGGYCYRRLQVAGSERYVDKPEKNIYSHVTEALEYAMLGRGHGYDLIQTPGPRFQPKVLGNF